MGPDKPVSPRYTSILLYMYFWGYMYIHIGWWVMEKSPVFTADVSNSKLETDTVQGSLACLTPSWMYTHTCILATHVCIQKPIYLIFWGSLFWRKPQVGFNPTTLLTQLDSFCTNQATEAAQLGWITYTHRARQTGVSTLYNTGTWHCCTYSGTPLIWTLLGQKKASWLVRCPYFRGWKVHKHGTWGGRKCPV